MSETFCFCEVFDFQVRKFVVLGEAEVRYVVAFCFCTQPLSPVPLRSRHFLRSRRKPLHVFLDLAQEFEISALNLWVLSFMTSTLLLLISTLPAALPYRAHGHDTPSVPGKAMLPGLSPVSEKAINLCIQPLLLVIKLDHINVITINFDSFVLYSTSIAGY